jgi:hypothetical protein
MKLFRLKSIKFRGFFYEWQFNSCIFMHSTTFISDQLISTTFLNRETSGDSQSVIDSTYYIPNYISKGILCPRNNNVHHTSEDVLNSLRGLHGPRPGSTDKFRFGPGSNDSNHM